MKQDYVLAPVLFNLFFTCMLSHTGQDLGEGVYIRYHPDGSLFDLQCLKAKMKTLQKFIQETLFADDCALMAYMYRDLQLMFDKFPEALKLLGMTVSLG